MSLIRKVICMLGLKSKPREPDVIEASVKNAVQANESASYRAQAALQEYKATKTIRELAGKM